MAAALRAVQATGLSQGSVQPQLTARSRAQVGGVGGILPRVGRRRKSRRRLVGKAGI